MRYFPIILICVLSTMCALGDNIAEAKRFFDEYEVRLTETKVALIGDSAKAKEIADLVLVNLSNHEKITLLERESINKVIKEHKLASWFHNSKDRIQLGELLNVDLFAVLQVKDKSCKFMVFDAHSAVRIIDQQFPENSTEQQINKIVELLEQATVKIALKSRLWKVTLFSIRNVELPRNADAFCRNLAAELVRKIGELPDFSVIESRYIGLINEERELTQVFPSLAQASFLFNVDFYQSDIKNKALVKLAITVPGQESKHFTMNCNLETLQIPPKDFEEIIAYLGQEHHKAKISHEDEAARYYAEFKETFGKIKYAARLPKIEAAVAYDSSNRLYQQKLLQTIAGCALQEYNDKNNHRSAEEKINRYLDLMERSDKLTLLYNKVNYPHVDFMMSYHPILKSISGFDPLNNNHSKLPDFSEETKQRLATYHQRYIDHIHNKYRLKHWMNPKVKLNSRHDMFYFDLELTSLAEMHYYSQSEYLSHSIPLVKLYLEKTAQTDENFTDENVNGRVISWHFWNRFFVCFKNTPAKSNQFTALEEVAQTATTHPWPFVRLYGEFALYLADAKRNLSQSEKALSKFFKHMEAILKTLPEKENSDSLINLYYVSQLLCSGALKWVEVPRQSYFCATMKSHLLEIMQQRNEMYFPMARSAFYIIDAENYNSVKQFLIYLNSGKWAMIGRKMNSSSMEFVNDMINRKLAHYLSRNPQLREVEETQPFTVEQLKSFESLALKVGISDSGQYIYWSSLKNNKIEMYSYSTVSAQSQKIGESISLSQRPSHINIAIGQNHLAISVKYFNLVIIYDLKTGETTKLTIPFARPSHIAIVDRDLLVWCEEDNNLLQYQLPSLTYKVIYSANRRHTDLDPFNNQTVRFDTMFADQKRKRVVIILSGYNLKKPGWWYYYPAQQKFEYISRYPDSSQHPWTKLTPDKVLLASANYSFILNLKDNTKELLFYALSPNRSKIYAQRMKDDFEKYYGAKARVTLKSFSTSYTLSAGTIVDNYFWSNLPWYRINLATGEKTFYPSSGKVNAPALILHSINNGKLLLLVNANGIFKLNLEKPKDSPLLMVPAGVNLFRLKAKTYLFVREKQISIAELK